MHHFNEPYGCYNEETNYILTGIDGTPAGQDLDENTMYRICTDTSGHFTFNTTGVDTVEAHDPYIPLNSVEYVSTTSKYVRLCYEPNTGTGTITVSKIEY